MLRCSKNILYKIMNLSKWPKFSPGFELFFGWLIIKVYIFIVTCKKSIRMCLKKECLDTEVDNVAIIAQSMKHRIILNSLFCELISNELDHCVIVCSIITHKKAQFILNSKLSDNVKEDCTQILSSMLPLKHTGENL